MEEQQKVLIVDDERFNVNVLAELLKPEYKIMAAKNGEQALKAARIANPPDLILLDIMMPEMDGYEVCRRLKADVSTRDIPVIFVTAMGDTSDETKGFEIGAVDYITKPISPPIVQARVKTHLTLRRNMAELKNAYSIIETQKERMQDELNVGHDIQMSMVPQVFPPFPDRKELSIFADLQPAREVGGDFYDFFFIDENRLCVCVGDVSDKGVAAALFMAVTRTLIKARATEDLSTASILTRVNDELSRDNKAYMFVTMFTGILNVITGEFIYTNAGHNPTYIKRANGSIERLENLHGPVIGAAEGLAYKEDKTWISEGDLIFMYTDGVTEARNGEKDFFTENRLAELLSSHDFEDAKDAVQLVVQAVKQFEDGANQADDITALAVKYLMEPKPTEVLKLDTTLKNQISEIDRFKEQFETFSKEQDIPSAIRRKMNVVFDELLNNIISYAYQDETEHDINIRLEISGDRLLLSITDDGIPFNPFDADTPDTKLALEERTQGGLGIHLVRNVMDKVSYQRRAERNVINLVKYLDEKNQQ